jgi:penicillin-binding protein 1A
MRRLIRVFLFTAIIVFSVLSLVIIGGATVLYRYSKSEVSDDLLNAARSYEKTKFYCFEYEDRQFRTGNAKEIKNASLNSGIKCEYTSYEQLPENLINAFVAIEDKRFFTHKGIDYKRSVGAVLNYVFGGGKTFGGSTITQQLVKNLTGNDDRLVERKLAEAFSALELEKRYEKSEIIEMYMSIINLAHGCRGVGAASQYYFSKPLRELDICECAALAAITNNPSKYDPQLHPRENKQRRDIVLSCMLNCGYISQTEYDSAVK